MELLNSPEMRKVQLSFAGGDVEKFIDRHGSAVPQSVIDKASELLDVIDEELANL